MGSGCAQDLAAPFCLHGEVTLAWMETVEAVRIKAAEVRWSL